MVEDTDDLKAWRRMMTGTDKLPEVPKLEVMAEDPFQYLRKQVNRI